MIILRTVRSITYLIALMCVCVAHWRSTPSTMPEGLRILIGHSMLSLQSLASQWLELMCLGVQNKNGAKQS